MCKGSFVLGAKCELHKDALVQILPNLVDCGLAGAMALASAYMQEDLGVLLSRPLNQTAISNIAFYAPPHFTNIHSIGATKPGIINETEQSNTDNNDTNAQGWDRRARSAPRTTC